MIHIVEARKQATDETYKIAIFFFHVSPPTGIWQKERKRGRMEVSAYLQAQMYVNIIGYGEGFS